MFAEWPYFPEDDDPDNLVYADDFEKVERLCHGCGKVAQMHPLAFRCAMCLAYEREGMDIAYRDDNFDER